MSALLAQAAWRPAGGIKELEDAAWEAVRETQRHQVVMAGPGAGKTELLAQRAAFLLQTGAILGERRILALAFKRDAAANLGERVQRRCGPRLGHRFTSLTIDAFAKGLVDRFGLALPPDRRPPATYQIVGEKDPELLGVMHQGVALAAKSAPGTEHAAVAAAAKRHLGDREFLVQLGRARECWSPYQDTRPKRRTAAEAERLDAARWATPHAWRSALESGRLSWDMVKRMAVCLVAECPAVRRALRQTYAHLFLDEVQDVTQLQLELVYTCFPPATALLTAVGDERQGIMAWAGAVSRIFDWLQERYDAERRELVLNHRAGGRLVAIQHVLMREVSGTAPAPRVARSSREEHGRCAVWTFADDTREAETITECVSALMRDGVPGHEICLLARQRVVTFAPVLIRTLASRGIAARVEEAHQDVARDPCARVCRALVALAVRRRAPDEFTLLLDLLAGSARRSRTGRRWLDDEGARHVRNVVRTLSARLPSASTDPAAIRQLLEEAIEALVGSVATLAGAVVPAQPASDAMGMIGRTAELLAGDRAETPTWEQALNRYDGIGVIPIMTVHKSKGLEYDTVIFVGLDDQEWWSFPKTPEEDRRTFFVAFSRAKERVLFTFSHARDRGGRALEPRQRTKIDGLYGMLQRAGVDIVDNPDAEAHNAFIASTAPVAISA